MGGAREATMGMRFACRITKVTDHARFSPLAMVSRTRRHLVFIRTWLIFYVLDAAPRLQALRMSRIETHETLRR